MEGVNDALVSKIQKLMALRDKNDNIHQAEAAAAKIQELIAQHGINLVELEAAGKRNKEQIVETGFRFHEPIHDAPEWEVILADYVARANDCRILVHGKTAKGANFYNIGTMVGQPHDVEVALYFFAYLRDTIWYLSLKEHKAFFGRGAKRSWSWLMDFCRGASTSVGVRLVAQKRSTTQATTGTTMALVVQKDKEVANYMEKYTNMSDPYRGAKNKTAELLGYERGQHIPINEAVKEGEEVRKLA